MLAPAAVLGAFLLYVRRFAGWGQWVAAPLLLLPDLLSIPVTATGVALVLVAHRSRSVTVAVVGATILAALPLLWLGYRALGTH
jgi:hypothetical protein